jgi:hypothetical protein
MVDQDYGKCEAEASQRHPPRCRPARRRGLATMWLIMFGPVFLVMLYFVVEIGHLYLAKTELNNALEAAALAGAQRWSQAGATTADARALCQCLCAGQHSQWYVSVVLDQARRRSNLANPEQNVSCSEGKSCWAP